MDLEKKKITNYNSQQTYNLKTLSTNDFWRVVNKYGIIAGGYPAWIISGCPVEWYPKDLDIFTTSKANYDFLCSFMTVNKCSTIVETKNAHSFNTNNSPFINIRGTIQIIQPDIFRDITNAETLIKSFDLNICSVAFLYNEDDIPTSYIGHYGVEYSILSRELEILNIECPIGTLQRVLKYYRKGFRIDPSELYKLFLNWDTFTDDTKNIYTEILINKSKDPKYKDIRHRMLYVDS